MKKLFILTSLCAFFAFFPLLDLKAKEELLIVQTVSKDRKSFVVSKGIKDGVIKGQEIVFANDNASIVCKAVEVNRGYSLWVPLDRTITVPFNKEDVISSNSTIYGNVALEIIADPSLTLATNYNEVFKKFRSMNNYTLKASINRGLYQSTSSVDEERNPSRTGYNFSAEYNYRFLPEFEMSFGGRIDNEVYRLEASQLDIPTQRVMATIAATYHFVNFSKNQNNFYLTIAAGIGRSVTTIDSDKSSGTVTLLPEARLGFLMPLNKGIAMVFEGSVESLSATETLTVDVSEIEQTTNILNMKASIGLRF